MILLTPELRCDLRANAVAHHAALLADRPEPDPVPLLKLFNPLGAAMWLATELDADDDTLFGLADLGFGSSLARSACGKSPACGCRSGSGSSAI